MIERLLIRAVLPYTRHELPGWGHLLGALRVLVPTEGPAWNGARVRVIRGKDHGFLMKLDLSDWAQRMTFCLGRYYELGVLQVLDKVLGPGDAFVDFGANIGMVSLHARSLVGDAGVVHSYEPNPDCLRLLQEHVELNKLRNVFIHGCALSDTAGELPLSLTSEHTGTATLAPVPAARRTYAVPVRVGDEALIGISPKVVKIDVEGFEVHVLRGLRDTLIRTAPFVITEVEETLLRRAGTTTQELISLMSSLGYRAYGIGTRRTFFRWHLSLSPLRHHQEFVRLSDVLWVPAGSIHFC